MKKAIPMILVILFLSCQSEKKQDSKAEDDTESNVKSQLQLEISNDYQGLVQLFKAWRTFENPQKLDGATDYTKTTFENRWPTYKDLQYQLKAIDTTNWTIQQHIAWMIELAEMNGY